MYITRDQAQAVLEDTVRDFVQNPSSNENEANLMAAVKAYQNAHSVELGSFLSMRDQVLSFGSRLLKRNQETKGGVR